jgi:hypothetical protein
MASMLCFSSSCGNDFLHEEQSTAFTTRHFETEEGILALATGLYGNIRWHFGFEWAYAITLVGTDEFSIGNDNTSEPWYIYSNAFGPSNWTTATGAPNANCPTINGLWDQVFFGIANANLVIANATNITDEELRNRCLGEAYFLRGYNYYRLFAQYGGVPLIDKPIEGVVRNFQRASDEETMAFILSDFEQAYHLLPVDRWRGTGTWTKYTAAHFRAKSLLHRASERNDAWNGNYKSSDLDLCITLCDEVMTACPLESNFRDVYARWTGIDCEIEASTEVLMSCQNNANSSTQGRFGNRTHSYFTPQFNTFSGNWANRGPFNGGSDFQRCRPTEYNYSTYDNVNDARLWKSFRTVYGVNHIANADLNGSFGDNATALGEIAIVFILNKRNDSRFDGEPFGRFGRPVEGGSRFIHPETNKWVPCAFPLYLDGRYVLTGYSSNGNPSRSNVFCGLNKTQDGTRTADGGNAYRDVIMARTGETYLIKAEAQVRKNDFSGAIATVNRLRGRAEWKDGEDRELYVDGAIGFMNNAIYTNNTNYTRNATHPGKDWMNYSHPGFDNGNLKDASGNVYLCKNSYYLSTGIGRTTAPSSLQIASHTTLPAEDEAILSALGVSGDYDRMLNFIFNERTRELNGEWNRWEELSRTKLLVKRTKVFNPEASANIKDHHNLRPIPQTFIDGLLNEDGSELTGEQKSALQNPGY